MIDWQLTLVFMLGLPLIAFAIRKFGKQVRRAAKYSMRQYARMVEAAQETMQAPAVVRLHNARATSAGGSTPSTGTCCFKRCGPATPGPSARR